MTLLQEKLPLIPIKAQEELSYAEQVRALLASDLDFHGQDSAYASHNYHAFPAKFPPQLPRVFIEALTQPGDIVLDPMAGSGTTVVEAMLLGRQGIGTDIDPMALRIGQVKTTAIDTQALHDTAYELLKNAHNAVRDDGAGLKERLAQRFAESEHTFLDYWFLPEIQLELMALIEQIEKVQDVSIRAFLETVFSAIIITKSGGVSLARDLAHTRPHRVSDKPPRSPLSEYAKRLKKNLKSAVLLNYGGGCAQFFRGNAQAIALADNTVDLIVTSPPYAANAIDYMRAHKFSLIWLGHTLKNLSDLRSQYIGHDALAGFEMQSLPKFVAEIVTTVGQLDAKKGGALHRYYSEATLFLREMLRVLKPGRAAMVVVGSSTMRNIDTQTGQCLAEIGKTLGFAMAEIGVRKLDRDKRMMPARRKLTEDSTQIEARMHEEYVIALIKPQQE